MARTAAGTAALQAAQVEAWRVAEAARLLHDLVPVRFVADRFDASYLEDLPHILREAYGVGRLDAKTLERLPALAHFVAVAGLEDVRDPADLPARLRALGLKDDDFLPRRASARTKIRHREAFMRTLLRRKGRSVGAGGDVEDVRRLQVEYSLHQGGRKDVDFESLHRAETGDPWTPLLQGLVQKRVLKPGEPALTLGPRWGGEIRYFREVIGLRGTIGLDLFSHDEELVKVGDMHGMPFEDGTFGLVYQRNTFDKAYDIRKALDECVRVLRPGGILVSDDCYDYTDGVSEVARTNIKCNAWMLACLGPRVKKVLLDRETPTDKGWFGRVGQLAVQLKG